MDKKGIFAVTICLALLVYWTYFQQKYIERQNQARAQAAQLAAAKGTSPAAAPSPIVSAPNTLAAGAPPPPVTAAIPEQSQEIDTEGARYFFTTRGGGIAKTILLKHKAENGQDVSINQNATMPIGAVTERAGEDVKADYTLQQQGKVVTFQRVTGDQLEINKAFTLPTEKTGPAEYEVKMELSFTNRGSQPRTLPSYFVYAGAAQEIHKTDLAIYTSLDWLREGKMTNITTSWFNASGILGLEWSQAKSVYSEVKDKIAWLGVSGQYFTTIVASPENAGSSVWGRKVEIDFDGVKQPGIEGALGLPGLTLAPGQTVKSTFNIYCGPKELGSLAKLPQEQKLIMNFGMFRWVSELLLNSMNTLHSWLGSYAAAIIALTLIVKSLLWPLQNKATNSMKRMSLLQPRMTELREKYKDDPTRMNTEVMKLYKQYGINPLSGCLPMLVQIPIFFGLYSMLRSAVELRHSSFLWVSDLSQPDTVLHLGGFPLNILPLVMAGTMFWQMSLTPKTGDPLQQRIMMFTPLIFIAFCYNYASALALYWTVQNTFTIVQLYVTRNQVQPTLEKITPPKK